MKALEHAIRTGAPLMMDPFIAQTHLERVSQFASMESIVSAKTAADAKSLLEMVFGPQPKYESSDGMAYIPLKGVIGKGLSPLEKATSGIDLEEVQEWIKEAAADPKVKVVYMDIDSPGGTVRGTPETAKAYRELGKVKQTVSFTDGKACSAAYYIGSQGNRFLATPSSSVGNVGVFAAVADMSGAMEKAGVKMKVYKAGKYKGMGHPGVQMTEEMDSFMQQDVNEDWMIFKSDVKAVRSHVKDEDLEGQTFSGKQAAEKCLVTGVVNCWDEAVRRTFS